MIRLISSLPEIAPVSAEYQRIRCIFDAYRDDKSVLFWEQNGGQAILSLADGNLTVYNPHGETEELLEFFHMISPKTVFSDEATLNALGLLPYRRLAVLCRRADISGEPESDALNSREIYDLFSAGGLTLPEYPFFAVDFCRRYNRGGATYFGLQNRCAAVSVFSGDFALLTGIVSLKKGAGTKALDGILQKNRGRTVLVCCEESVKPFYLKNGFKTRYYAGSWKYEHS